MAALVTEWGTGGSSYKFWPAQISDITNLEKNLKEYIVQPLTSNTLDTTARVTICTIQRLFSMLKGRQLAPEDDAQSADGLGNLFARPEPIRYNKDFPIETFDVIVDRRGAPQHLQPVAPGAGVFRRPPDRPTDADKQRIVQVAGVASRKELARGIVDALNPDNHTDRSPGEVDALIQRAVKPLCDPALRKLLMDLKKQAEQIIDTVTRDELLEADFSEAARERPKGTVASFQQFIADHEDEITALQILYNRPQRRRGGCVGSQPGRTV